MYRTLEWIAEHDGRALANAITGYFPDIPVERLAACCDTYRSLAVWNRTPVLQREGLEWLRDAMLAVRAIRRKIEYEECVDMRFVEQIMREDPPPLT